MPTWNHQFFFILPEQFQARPHVSEYFWIRSVFFADSKISPFHGERIRRMRVDGSRIRKEKIADSVFLIIWNMYK